VYNDTFQWSSTSNTTTSGNAVVSSVSDVEVIFDRAPEFEVHVNGGGRHEGTFNMTSPGPMSALGVVAFVITMMKYR
jgi:hypothetical protein